MIEWRGEERQEISMDVNKELQLYKKTVRFFSESANDYLYVLDLVNRRIHIADKICGKYPLPLPGEEGIPLECWEGIVHHRDRRQLQKEIEEIAQGRNYRLTDRDGHRVWINAKSEVQTDDGGKRSFWREAFLSWRWARRRTA